MSTLTLTNLNLPDNPTARRLLELIGEYQVRYVLLEDGVRFTSPDLSEAKGQHEKDFTNHFLPNLTTNKNGESSENSSSNPDDIWVLEGHSLREFKDIYDDQLGVNLGRINKLTVVGWNTAYHYLVQGHSETAKDFSDLAYDHFLEGLNSNSDKPVKGSIPKSDNLPPLPNNATARRFMELVEQYNLNCYEWVEEFWYIGSDLCEAKNTDKWDFAKNFLGTSISEKYLKLEGENLKTFKKSLPQEKYEKVKFAPSLYLADWNTAYHYLVQGHSKTAKDFSNLGSESVAESFNEENQNQYKLPQNYIEALEALVSSEKQKKLAEEQKQLAEEKTQQVEGKLGEAEDTIYAYRAIASPESCLDVTQIAKAIGIPTLGRNNLFDYLRSKSFIQQKPSVVPYQSRIDCEHAVVDTYTINVGGYDRVKQKTKFTFKGLEWLVKKLKSDRYPVHTDAQAIWDFYNS